jgi:hypothetical protein
MVNPELTTSIGDVGVISLAPDVVVKYTILIAYPGRPFEDWSANAGGDWDGR